MNRLETVTKTVRCSTISAGVLKTLALIGFFYSMTLQAQAESDADWPCIQRLVPTVDAAVVWPGVIDDDLKNQWLNDDVIREMANNLGDVDEVTDEMRAGIAEFAQSLSGDNREAGLNKLADGVLHVANERRSLFIKGIKKYTRQQTAVAGQIEDFLNQIDALDVQKVSPEDPKRAEIQETLQWHQRVFEQRERQIISLCEQPVAIEESMGDVLREIAQYLP